MENLRSCILVESTESTAECTFSPGQRVLVRLKSGRDRASGLGVVARTPEQLALPPDSAWAGRYLVKFVCGNCQAHVRPERMQALLEVGGEASGGSSSSSSGSDDRPLLLITAHTLDYRRLARSMVRSSDSVLELGCSYGCATSTLAQHAAAVLGVDNSQEVVDEARRRYPGLRFEVADVLTDADAVLRLAREAAHATAGCTGAVPCSCTSRLGAGSSTGAVSAKLHHDLGALTLAAAAAADAAESSGSPAAAPSATAYGLTAAQEASVIASASRHERSGSGNGSPGSEHPGTSSTAGGGCSTVFLDIGGNRDLPPLLHLVPWLLRMLSPRLLVVKSEELAAAAAAELTRQHTEQQLQLQQQKKEGEEEKGTFWQRCGRIEDPAGWWAQLQVAESARTGLST
jgi:Methyltransferase domain